MEKSLFKMMLSAIMTLCSLTAGAADIFYSDEHFDYELNGEKTLYISAGLNLKGDVTLPSKVSVNGEYYTVTGMFVDVIIDAKELTGLTIPATLTYIDYPYHEHVGENYSLRKVVFEDAYEPISVPGSPDYPLFGHTSVEYAYIGRDISYRFDYQAHITTLTGSVAMAANCAPFRNLKALSSVEFGEGVKGVPHGLFAGCINLASVKLPKAMNYIGVIAFSGCSSLKTLSIPDSVEKIEAGAFMNCAMEEQKLPASLRAIGTKAFYGCSALVKADLPASVDSVYQYAFGKCDLRVLSMPAKTSYIGQYAFEGNKSLERVIGTGAVKKWPAGVFKDCGALASADLPATQDTIFKETFYGCSRLSLVIPPTVNMLEYNSCSGVSKLAIVADSKEIYAKSPVEADTLVLYRPITSAEQTRLTLRPKHLVFGNQEEVPEYLCYNSYTLQSVIIEEGVKTIGERAFSEGNVKYMTLPSTLTSIGSNAIKGNSNWTLGEAVYTINRPTPPSAADDAFVSVSKIRLDVPEGSYAAYMSTAPWNKFGEISDGTVYQITFPDTRYDIVAGDSLKLALSHRPAALPMPTLVWTSSNPEVASVNETGVVRGLSKGSATITAQSVANSYAKASVEIRVSDRSTERIVLSAHDVTMPFGSDTLLTATVYPEGAPMTEIKWAATGNVSVDNSGLVTANRASGAGQVIAYYSYNRMIADTCLFNITASGITLSADTLRFELNADKKRQRLTVSTKPSSSASMVEWRIDDTSVAEIDEKGYVTPKGLGETTVYAELTDGSGLMASCAVIVKPTLVESIVLRSKSLTLLLGETGQIVAEVNPSTAYDTALTYTPSANIISVDEDGYVTPLTPGETDVTVASAYNPEVSAVCHVIVKAVLAEELFIDPQEWTSEEGMTFTITATIYPENTTDKTILWRSSNQDVAQVDGEGNVTLADVDGNCVISASTTDGSNLIAECYVTTFAGIADIIADEGNFSLYDLRGILLQKDCDKNTLRQMEPGTYIIIRDSTATKIIIR